MNSPSAHRAKYLMLIAAIFFICAMAPEAVAQPLPTRPGAGKPPDKAATVRRERRKARQAEAPVASRTAASVESDNFIDLGDRFRARQNWNAAEAAYKEAVRVWPGNADALSELGHLYVDRSKWSDAQQTYSKLRAVNGSYAAELLAEINRRQAQLKH